MAFGMPKTQTGDFLPVFKYNSLSGRWFTVDRDASGVNIQNDITTPDLKFAIDFAALQVGFIYFGPSGPVKVLTAFGQPLPEQPQDKDEKGKLLAKPGISVRVAGRALGGVREVTSTTLGLIDSLDDFYNVHVAQAPEFAAGQIPLVSGGNSIPISRGSGAQRATHYRPSFELRGWVARLPEMGPRTVFPQPSNGHAVTQPQPAPAVQHSAPAQAAKAQLVGDEMPF